MGDAPSRTVSMISAPYALGLLAASVIALAPAQGRTAEPASDAIVAADEAGPSPEITPAALSALQPLGPKIGETRKLEVLEAPAATPPIVFTDRDGGPVALADFKGKVVLLNFWATFCAPCLEEMPALNTLQKKLGGEDFEVVAVNLDPTGLKRPLAWLEEHGIDKLAVYHDRSYASIRALGSVGMPTTLLIDRSGQEVARLLGAAAWADAEAVEAIEILIRNEAAAG